MAETRSSAAVGLEDGSNMADLTGAPAAAAIFRVHSGGSVAELEYAAPATPHAGLCMFPLDGDECAFVQQTQSGLSGAADAHQIGAVITGGDYAACLSACSANPGIISTE